MKKAVGIIGSIATMAVIATGSYYLGTTHAETITEIQTVTEIREVEKVVEIVPDGCMDTTTDEFIDDFVDMRQVIDFTTDKYGLQIYFDDGSGYYWER